MAKKASRPTPPGPALPTTHYEAPRGFHLKLRAPGPPWAPHAHTHPEIELNFLLGGRMTYVHGGAQHVVEAGRVAMFWAGVPHHILAPGVTGPGVWSCLPLAWVLQWKLPRDLVGRLLAGNFIQFEFPPALPGRWLEDFASKDPERRHTLSLELPAALARMALSLPAGQEFAASDRRDARGADEHIVRVTSFIAAHYTEPLTTGAIARIVKLNPTYLMGLFRRRCHLSLWEYVMRLRVSHAQRLLMTTDLGVLEVAMESGFGSPAPFYVAFTRYCGMRPLAFRKQQRAANA